MPRWWRGRQMVSPIGRGADSRSPGLGGRPGWGGTGLVVGAAETACGTAEDGPVPPGGPERESGSPARPGKSAEVAGGQRRS